MYLPKCYFLSLSFQVELSSISLIKYSALLVLLNLGLNGGISHFPLKFPFLRSILHSEQSSQVHPIKISSISLILEFNFSQNYSVMILPNASQQWRRYSTLTLMNIRFLPDLGLIKWRNTLMLTITKISSIGSALSMNSSCANEKNFMREPRHL